MAPMAEILGLALILVAVVLFLLEVKVPGFGALGVGGVVALVAGLVFLFGLTAASIPMLLALTLPLLALLAFLTVLAHRARRGKVVTGDAGMVGLEGRAETELAPAGKVFVRGELWDAWSAVPVQPGAPVVVTGVRGLRLEVTTALPEHTFSKRVSVVPVDPHDERGHP